MVSLVFSFYIAVAILALVIAMARQDWAQSLGSCACLLALAHIMPPSAG